MPPINPFAKKIKESLASLQAAFPHSVSQPDDHSILVAFEHCNIRYQTDRFYAQLSVKIETPSGQFIPQYIYQLRQPGFEAAFQAANKQPNTEKISRHIKIHGRLIAATCRDILGGDYSIKADYLAKAKEESDLLMLVMKLAPDNPIRKKFYAGDLSWKEELKEKYPKK